MPQVVVPAIALAVTLALLTLVIPGNSPSYQPSTAALNVDPRVRDGAPSYGNAVPTLLYKADGASASVDMSGLPGLLSCGIPEANLSIAESPLLGVAEAETLPDSFGFIAAAGSSPPNADLARLSTAMLSDASLRAATLYGAWAFTNNGSLLPGQDTGSIDASASSAAE